MASLIPDENIISPYAIDWGFGPLPKTGERALVIVPGYFIGIVYRGASDAGVTRWTTIGSDGTVGANAATNEGNFWAFYHSEWSEWLEVNAWWYVIG